MKKYFSYSDAFGAEIHDTASGANTTALRSINHSLGDIGNPHRIDNVDRTCWGLVVQSGFNVMREDDIDIDDSSEAFLALKEKYDDQRRMYKELEKLNRDNAIFMYDQIKTLQKEKEELMNELTEFYKKDNNE